MRDAAADAPAAKWRAAPGQIPGPASGGSLYLPQPGLPSMELFGEARKKKTGDAVFVTALLVVQHPRILPARQHFFFLWLGGLEIQSGSDPGQLRSIGRLDEKFWHSGQARQPLRERRDPSILIIQPVEAPFGEAGQQRQRADPVAAQQNTKHL